MRLSNIAILALKGFDKENKERIAKRIKTSTNSFYRYIAENKDNGELTKVGIIKVLSEETGLTQEQLLEDEKEPELVAVAIE